MSVELYACGFNAHQQLVDDESEKGPYDVDQFRCIVAAEDVKLLYAGWADTLCEESIGGIQTQKQMLIVVFQ